MKITHTDDYRARRAKAYPDIGDQLDELWKLLDSLPGAAAGDIKASPLLAAVKAVKARYPKPAAGRVIAAGPAARPAVAAAVREKVAAAVVRQPVLPASDAPPVPVPPVPSDPTPAPGPERGKSPLIARVNPEFDHG